MFSNILQSILTELILFDSALTEYKHLLKPGGALIIAIENKMGLKYFAGYNEDHYLDPYVGIEDRYVEKKCKNHLVVRRLLIYSNEMITRT